MDDSRIMLYEYAFKKMAALTGARVPDSGQFQAFSVYLEDPGDKLTCTLEVKPAYQNPARNACIVLGCIVPGTDMLRSVFVCWGSRQELVDWFLDPGSLQTALNHYRVLREKCLEDT